jgi:hypothetical protein
MINASEGEGRVSNDSPFSLDLRPAFARVLRTEVVLGLALALATGFAMGGACVNDFMNYDDDVYVSRNLNVLSGLGFDTLVWAFTTTRSNHWHPLTWISLQLDADLWGQGPWGFHFVNLLLHVANVLLLFGIMCQMTGAVWRSALVAGVFAVHPLHVESVAWVTERKDVLSTFFWLIATAAYVHYSRQPGWRRYRWVVLFFTLGLLAKPMVMTLPFTLLLLDYWPLGRFSFARGCEHGKAKWDRAGRSFGWLVAEKLPLFALAVLSGVASLLARAAGGGIKSGIHLSLDERLGYVVTAYAGYLGKLIRPVDLAPYYPLTPGGVPLLRVAGSLLLLAVLTGVLLWASGRRPYLAVGWLWYLVTLIPASGIVQLGSYAMADRYVYVPSIGLLVLGVWWLGDFVPRAASVPVYSTALVILVALALATREQVRYWHDSIALWEHALAVTPDNLVARTDLGMALAQAGRWDEADAQLAAAVQRWPERAITHDNLGLLRLQRGMVPEAIDCFAKAAELEPAENRYNAHLTLARDKLAR